MTTGINRGANWSIWDLHVHSPSSIVQNYGADNEPTWSKFIDELESLPEDIRVIGLNDYWFLDGYRRVRAAKEVGRLKNLDAIFPVLELRIDQFGGTDSKLARANLHVIFDPDLDPEVIQQQFIGRLSGKFSLRTDTVGADWHGAVTKDSLTALGAKIKEQVPSNEVHRFASDLQEGFNQLNIPLDSVTEVLESSFLKGRALIGLGKTEWAAIKWNNQAVASKRNLVSTARFLFTAFEDPSDWPEQVDKLKNQNVNHRLLDCSDAHDWSSSTNKDRLGACSTWMNTTPTFAGLIHALDEFDNRVFVGLEPPALGRVRRSPEQFIDKIEITSSDPDEHRLFNYELPLNAGFVAVVGNKGQGKSALLDCIAVAGNSSRAADFAFLNPTRFLTATNKAAKEYEARLTWRTGTVRSTPLNAKHDAGVPVAIEYLPQRYVENVCTIDPLSAESHHFEDELREVLFTHIPEQDRSGEVSFEGLISRKTEAALDQASKLRSQLRKDARRYAELIDFIEKNVPAEIENLIALKQVDVDTASAALIDDRASLDKLDSRRTMQSGVGELRAESEVIADRIKTVQQELNENRALIGILSKEKGDVEALLRKAQQLKSDASALNEEAIELLARNGSDLNATFVDLTVRLGLVTTWKSSSEERALRARNAIKDLELQDADLQARAKEIANALASVDSTRELARQRVLQSEQRLQSLVGSVELQGSLQQLQKLLADAQEAPDQVLECMETMLATSAQIHESLLEELSAVVDLYGPASEFIAQSEVVRNAGLEFRAELEFTAALHEFGNQLDGRKNSDLGQWISSMSNRLSAMEGADLAADLKLILQRLKTDRGLMNGAPRNPTTGLRNGVTLADFLSELLGLSWIEVRFGLTGDGLPLSQLSPGQRGLILALFYLIVDRRTTPLLLDQPEENLDNATIASLLVPAIREAAARRQTIIVTHNANLAVVGDADQIVHASFRQGRFEVSGGCISEVVVAQSAIDVLEGTKPAFDNRRHKYEAFPAL